MFDYFSLVGFSNAEEQEIIIQSVLQKPGSPVGSPPSLQRLFAHIARNEYRLASAFTTVQ